MIATSPEHCKEVMPSLCEVLGRTRIALVLLRRVRDLEQKISTAPEDVKSFAVEYFRKAFENVPNEFVDEATGYTMIGGARYAKKRIAGILVDLPEGAEIGRKDPKATLAYKRSGDEKDMYIYSGTFSPNEKFVGKWLYQIDVAPDKLDTIEAEIKKKISRIERGLEELAKKRAKRAKNPNAKKQKKSQRVGGALGRLIRKVYLTLKDNGDVGENKFLFWTDDTLIDNGMGEARKMRLYTIKGKTYLLVEKGGFDDEEIDRSEDSDDESGNDAGSADERVPPDWHCGYEVYERVE
ncbi:MAG: hypothetical protein RRC34_01220 [Lentisphaeria bacterium]|nr:hypothetical protein [Lentisphaeria bacterium]